MTKRIGNLEFRKASYLCGEEDLPKHIGYDINKWVPNSYYGKESDFIKDSEFYRPNSEHYSFCRIHKDCFTHPEYCYSISRFYWDNSEGCYEFEFIGNRPTQLIEEERKVFWELVDYGFKQLNPWWYEEE